MFDILRRSYKLSFKLFQKCRLLKLEKKRLFSMPSIHYIYKRKTTQATRNFAL